VIHGRMEGGGARMSARGTTGEWGLVGRERERRLPGANGEAGAKREEPNKRLVPTFQPGAGLAFRRSVLGRWGALVRELDRRHNRRSLCGAWPGDITEVS